MLKGRDNGGRYAGDDGDPAFAGTLEDALHVMEVLSTVEGLESLEPTQVNARLLPTGDEEIVSVFPTGWHDNIRTLTMTGSQIKELAAAGYDAYGNGNPFPYVLVTKGGMELDDDTTYTIPVCGGSGGSCRRIFGHLCVWTGCCERISEPV